MRQPRGAHVVLPVEEPREDVVALLRPVGLRLDSCGCGGGRRAGELHPYRTSRVRATAGRAAASSASSSASSSTCTTSTSSTTTSALAAGGAGGGGLAQAHAGMAIAPAIEVHPHRGDPPRSARRNRRHVAPLVAAATTAARGRFRHRGRLSHRARR